MADQELHDRLLSSADQLTLYSIALKIQTGLVLTNSAMTMHRTGAHRQVLHQLERADQIYSQSERRIEAAEAEGKDTSFVRQLLLDFHHRLERLRKACYGQKLNGASPGRDSDGRT